MADEKIKQIQDYAKNLFETNMVQALSDFVAIPNLSRDFDADYDKNGYMEKAANYCIDWATKLDVKGLSVKLVKAEGRLTPFLFGIIEPTKTDPKNVVCYGHLDKQPHLTEQWSEGLHPFKPVIKDGFMYGRGCSDDGYAFFTAVAFAKISQECGIPHDRIVLFFETDEESSSIDLEFYLDYFKDEIRIPDLFLCLDSGTPGYDRFATTTSLRGYVDGNITVSVIKNGVHSGIHGGIIPDSFRIMRMLFDRVEDVNTGRVVDAFRTPLPKDKEEFAKAYDVLFGEKTMAGFPILEGLEFENPTSYDNYVNNTWNPCFTITGMDGFPSTSDAGCVIRPKTSARFSMRIPPDLDPHKATETLYKILSENPPFGAKVEVEMGDPGSGWSCPVFKPELLAKMKETSEKFWGEPMAFQAIGGSIPFVNMLGSKFPTTALYAGGVGAPTTNAHGPDENISLEYWEKFTSAMTWMLSEL